jgi:CheY-like chemotaxis protein
MVLIKPTRSDLVLLDIALPGIGGIEACHKSNNRAAAPVADFSADLAI